MRGREIQEQLSAPLYMTFTVQFCINGIHKANACWVEM